MKKILLFIFFAILTVSVTAQEKVLIRTYNGEIKKFNMWDVEQIEFIVEDDTTNYATPGIVDLGLSVKWASFNLGANTITGTGRLFGWGALYDSMNSKLPIFYPSATPPESIVASNYDVAKVKLGDLWRMPTTDEIQELIDSCEWSWDAEQMGWYVKRGDAELFLPVTYSRCGTIVDSTIVEGNYWSSDLSEKDSASYLHFNSTDSCSIKSALRYMGFAVRPVYGEFVTPIRLSLETIDVTYSSLKAIINIEGGLENVEEGGLLYGMNPSIDINSASKLQITNITDKNVLTITALSPLTAYYIKAYVKVNGEYIYSDEISVKTKAQFPVADMVDLGLSVKWASWNMGAVSPADYGGYYCWDDPQGKGISNFVKLENISGTEYDIAHVQWGDLWRMPSEIEWQELQTECTWTYEENYENSGVNGMKVTGNNGNFIFLPLGGNMQPNGDDWLYWLLGKYGYYWSSTSTSSYSPIRFRFMTEYFNFAEANSLLRMSIRAVHGLTKDEKPGDDPTENGLKAVDLGLGVMWANMNIGSNSEEDYGKYFFWGDRDTTRTDFSLQSSFDNIGADINGTEFDVAHNVLGDGWRMPTQYELDQLINLCDWSWTSINGIEGFKVSNKEKPDNYIFLPAGGQILNNEKLSIGSCGYIWTSELYYSEAHPNDYAWHLYFDKTLPKPVLQKYYRDSGFNIRPVKSY